MKIGNQGDWGAHDVRWTSALRGPEWNGDHSPTSKIASGEVSLMIISERIIKVLKERNMTQAEFARELHSSLSFTITLFFTAIPFLK